MPSTDVPLYVRLPAAQAQRLSDVSEQTGQSKRQLVETAIRSHLVDDGSVVVGRVELREQAPEILTLEEAAGLLRVGAEVLSDLAQAGSVPGRRIGAEWRFSRPALLAWLASGPA